MNSKFRIYYLKQPILENKNLANKILREYYELITKEILQGNIYNFLGELKLVRRLVGKRKVVLSYETSCLREKTGDITQTVYRTNEDYHAIYWENINNYKFIKFKLARKTELNIPLNKENLMFVDTLTRPKHIQKFIEENEKSFV